MAEASATATATGTAYRTRQPEEDVWRGGLPGESSNSSASDGSVLWQKGSRHFVQEAFSWRRNRKKITELTVSAEPSSSHALTSCSPPSASRHARRASRATSLRKLQLRPRQTRRALRRARRRFRPGHPLERALPPLPAGSLTSGGLRLRSSRSSSSSRRSSSSSSSSNQHQTARRPPPPTWRR